MMVICAHGFVVLYPHFGDALAIFGHGGFYGVELFFVLSGFLIGQILIRNGSDLGQAGNVAFFYVRRWFRTLPLFFLFLIVNIAFERFFRAHPVGFGEGLSHGFFLRNFASFQMTFFPESWSLAIEEWFYLLFPAALWLGTETDETFRCRLSRGRLQPSSPFRPSRGWSPRPIRPPPGPKNCAWSSSIASTRS